MGHDRLLGKLHTLVPHLNLKNLAPPRSKRLITRCPIIYDAKASAFGYCLKNPQRHSGIGAWRQHSTSRIANKEKRRGSWNAGLAVRTSEGVVICR